jgi:hypothetical protein
MADQERRFLRVVKEDNILPFNKDLSTDNLEKLLKYLREKDNLFDYNVPENMRKLNTEGLQEHLIKTYSSKEIEVSGEKAVKKYIKVYDLVKFVNKEPGFIYSNYIKPGMKGIINNVDLKKDRPLNIFIDKSNDFPQEQNLDMDASWVKIIEGNIFKKSFISDKLEVLNKAEPGKIVEFTKSFFSYEFYIPVGTKGIVTNIDISQERPVQIIFSNSEGYIPNKNGTFLTSYSNLALIRENKINLEEAINKI